MEKEKSFYEALIAKLPTKFIVFFISLLLLFIICLFLYFVNQGYTVTTPIISIQQKQDTVQHQQDGIAQEKATEKNLETNNIDGSSNQLKGDIKNSTVINGNNNRINK